MSQVDPLCSALFISSIECPIVPQQPDTLKSASKEVLSDSRSDIVPSSYFKWKAAVEWVAAAMLVATLLPLIGLLALLIAVCNGRPVFYRQQRVGKNERLFKIWKFRTMRCDAEKVSGPVWSTPNDSRVTWLGRWLRATHLDEIPQLFNVLLGDMNIIGPRPERPEFVKELIRDIPDYSLRHAVRPGITGLAQVKQGYDTCVSDVYRKVTMDLRYIESASFFHDFSILILTVPYVLKETIAAINRRLRWRLATRNREDNRSSASGEPILTLKQVSDPIDLSIEEQICDEIFRQRQMLFNIKNEPSKSISRPHLAMPGQPSSSREAVENSGSSRDRSPR